MNPRFRDLWLIPLVVSVIGGIVVGIPLMVYAAWYSEHAPHSLVDWASVREALAAPIPTWTVLALGLLPMVLIFFIARIRKRMGDLIQTNTRLQADVARLRNPEPKIHVVWDPNQTFWHRGAIGQEPAMQIGGWALISSSDTTETLILRNGHIEGTTPRGMLPDIVIEPGIAKDDMIMMFVTPVIEHDETKPVTAKVVLEDQKNRKYVLPPHAFRGTPRPVQEAVKGDGRDSTKPAVT